MSALLPASTIPYQGHKACPPFLAFLALGTIIPGLIHSFLPDGGAGSIAGLDLNAGGPVIIGTFAWAGATQLAYGTLMLLVALRYRALVPLFFLIILMERSLIALNTWVLKPAGTGHHPPEAYATLALLPLVAAALYFSLKRRAGIAP